MLKWLMKRDFHDWEMPAFNISKIHLVIEAIEERDAFVRVDHELSGTGSIGKYMYYDKVNDALFVFRFPLTGVLNVYVHERGKDGKYGQDEGLKVASLRTSSFRPEEHRARFTANGWWIDYLNGLFRYLIDEKERETTGAPPNMRLEHLRNLEQEAASQQNKIKELFRA